MSKNKVLVLGGLDEDAITELKDDCEVMMGLVGHVQKMIMSGY